ncbi:hypothetical protein [Dyadobacter arcticus]|uniref:NodB homology domain-containing protein n=1 Tax=Dyadobacter arcticus TaxID=1078754 RepID=A0ABX0UJN9_9BACT|nr:hypothetical protein [Dyadobacter arcticus]NIJ52304.1 hypothetical protein [Dyadobacter arcticus]
MNRYIAYFDFLGYKQFILNNTSEYLRQRARHILRDIEMALSQEKYRELRPGLVIADLEDVVINCLNISDTIIFWTLDDSVRSLKELLAVAHYFNWFQIYFGIPLRGVVIAGEMEMLRGHEVNAHGAIYSNNLIYGQGLLKAHEKAESLNFAGCVIDESVINSLEANIGARELLSPFAKPYHTPYKAGHELGIPEYVLNIVNRELNGDSFDNFRNRIQARFSADNKPVNSPRVQELLTNTIEFLETYRVESGD